MLGALDQGSNHFGSRLGAPCAWKLATNFSMYFHSGPSGLSSGPGMQCL